ncbi:hypothetical protein NP493_21g08007 [Ridgeia piscesae]|uniref:Uncharacterized protein n=1 Tax=Ridgeia piscesae TaxID=27915 RepID=A0AAD9PDT6_RIDPI|nr:hypothetical protein NP493_21g08007 [Ridgeia piscesae]
MKNNMSHVRTHTLTQPQQLLVEARLSALWGWWWFHEWSGYPRPTRCTLAASNGRLCWHRGFVGGGLLWLEGIACLLESFPPFCITLTLLCHRGTVTAM